MTEKIIAVSGFFDPLHQGHIDYIRLAKGLGGKLVVILNSDEQVFVSIDKDGSVCESLRAVKPNIFAKGGDRFSSEIPEAKICEELGITIIDGLGKKIQSSSKLIKLQKEFEGNDR